MRAVRNDVKRKSKSRKAFEAYWKKLDPSNDDWGVPYVYDFGAYNVFLAGIRFAKSQSDRGAE
jgi:hypothetical protein